MMNGYKLKIVWMYHDIMDLYGDKGNMMVLQRRCEQRGIDVGIDTCGIGESCDLASYDLIFLGGGADREQMMLIDDLLSRRDNIQKAMDSGSFIFLVCGGYQLFGQYYIAADGSKINGLQFFDYYTDTGKDGTRCIGNIAIECELDGERMIAVGFENHGGQTCNVKYPLGRVLSGYGNNFTEGIEGFYNGQVFGTYLHGPLLPKNPRIADFMIVNALRRHHPQLTMEMLTPLDDTLEQKAREVLFRRMNISDIR